MYTQNMLVHVYTCSWFMKLSTQQVYMNLHVDKIQYKSHVIYMRTRRQMYMYLYTDENTCLYMVK